MNWLNILKKTDKEFEKSVIIKKEEETIIVYDSNIKNYEEEFDIKYVSTIAEIKKEFKDYINNLSLPFLDKENIKNDLYDYIKYNSTNLCKLQNKIEKENEEYLKDLEDDEEIEIDY